MLQNFNISNSRLCFQPRFCLKKTAPGPSMKMASAIRRKSHDRKTMASKERKIKKSLLKKLDTSSETTQIM
ncbi:MAG: hypothetical protein WDA00_01135 [Eubacteriales bacterium]